jgi:hypothetical protein
MKEKRNGGLSDLHRLKISEARKNEIKKVKQYYSEIEKKQIQQYE